MANAKTVAYTPRVAVNKEDEHNNGATFITPDEIIFEFNKERYTDRARHRVTNGIQTTHKLEALLVTAMHEVVHGIAYVWCKEHKGHSEWFKKMNHKVNGHSPSMFQYYDLV